MALSDERNICHGGDVAVFIPNYFKPVLTACFLTFASSSWMNQTAARGS